MPVPYLAEGRHLPSKSSFPTNLPLLRLPLRAFAASLFACNCETQVELRASRITTSWQRHSRARSRCTGPPRVASRFWSGPREAEFALCVQPPGDQPGMHDPDDHAHSFDPGGEGAVAQEAPGEMRPPRSHCRWLSRMFSSRTFTPPRASAPTPGHVPGRFPWRRAPPRQ